MVFKPRAIPMPAEIGYSLQRGRGGFLHCIWGVQTHRGPPVFLVPLRKDLARMNGTPQPNQKWLPAQGIEPGSLDHKSQPLTIGRFPDSYPYQSLSYLYFGPGLPMFPSTSCIRMSRMVWAPSRIWYQEELLQTGSSDYHTEDHSNYWNKNHISTVVNVGVNVDHTPKYNIECMLWC